MPKMRTVCISTQDHSFKVQVVLTMLSFHKQINSKWKNPKGHLGGYVIWSPQATVLSCHHRMT